MNEVPALRIGALSLGSCVVQSPMAACTDLPFRIVAREKGLGCCFLEMVSSQALVRDNAKTLRLLATAPGDRPLGAQLLGRDPAVMAEAGRVIQDLGFDVLDLNLGCPVKKVVSNGEGAALLREPDKAAALFKAVRSTVTRIPVTVKMRKGFSDETGGEAVRLARIAEDSGLAAVTVHGRTQAQGYSGRSDYGAIGRVKAAVGIPVIGNGDVVSPDDARRLRRESGCDGVMIGRAGLGNPWIYRDIDRAMTGPPRAPRVPAPEERRDTLLRHLDLEVLHLGERQAALNLRRIVMWYTWGLPRAKELRVAVCRTPDVAGIRRMIEDFFAALPPGVPPPQAPALAGE